MKESDNYSEKVQLKKLVVALIVLLSLGAFCRFCFKDQVMAIGHSLYDRFGPFSLVLGTLITDISPLPLTSEPVALIGLGAGMSLLNIILIMSVTSHLAGPIGYSFGYLLGKVPTIKNRFTKRLPTVCNWIEKHGVKGVALAAILPIPFALTTWTAGLLGVNFWGVVLASSLRWLKTATYVSLLAGGWFIGT